jgi:hypothetical protein
MGVAEKMATEELYYVGVITKWFDAEYAGWWFIGLIRFNEGEACCCYC